MWKEELGESNFLKPLCETLNSLSIWTHVNTIRVSTAKTLRTELQCRPPWKVPKLWKLEEHWKSLKTKLTLELTPQKPGQDLPSKSNGVNCCGTCLWKSSQFDHVLSPPGWEHYEHLWNVLHLRSSWYLCAWVLGSPSGLRRGQSHHHQSPSRLPQPGAQEARVFLLLSPAATAGPWPQPWGTPMLPTGLRSAWPGLPNSPGKRMGYRPLAMPPGRFPTPKWCF